MKDGKPLSNMAMLVLLQKRMDRADLTVQGSDRRFVSGLPRFRTSRMSSQRWRWRTRSRTQPRPRIGAATWLAKRGG
jgi:hypothetical protein